MAEENEDSVKFNLASPDVLSSRTILRARRRLNHGGDVNHVQTLAGSSHTQETEAHSTEATEAHSLCTQDTLQDKHFLRELKVLNKQVQKTIQSNLARNEGCLLTPIFHDYERHLRKLRQKYNRQARRRSTPFVRNAEAGNPSGLSACVEEDNTVPVESAKPAGTGKVVTFSGLSTLQEEGTSTGASLDASNPVVRLGLSQDSSDVPDSFKFAHPSSRKRKQQSKGRNQASSQAVPVPAEAPPDAAPTTPRDGDEVVAATQSSSPGALDSNAVNWIEAQISTHRSLPVTPALKKSSPALETLSAEESAPTNSASAPQTTPVRFNLAPVSSSRAKKTTVFAGKRVRTSLPFNLEVESSQTSGDQAASSEEPNENGEEPTISGANSRHSQSGLTSPGPVFPGYKIPLSTPFVRDSDSKLSGESESGSSISGDSTGSSESGDSHSGASSQASLILPSSSKPTHQQSESSSQTSSSISGMSRKSQRSKGAVRKSSSSKNSEKSSNEARRSKEPSSTSISANSRASQSSASKSEKPLDSNANGNAKTNIHTEPSTMSMSLSNVHRNDSIVVALATLNVHEQEERNAFFIKRCKLFHCRSGIWLDRGTGKLYLKWTKRGTHMVIRAESRRGTILASVVLLDSDTIMRRNKHTIALECFRSGDSTSGTDPGKTSGCLHIKMESEEAADELLGHLHRRK